VLFHKAQPGPEPLDVLASSRDPPAQVVVLTLERPDTQPGLRQLRAGVAFALSGTLRQLRLGALTARPPGGELLLDRRQELFELLQDDAISSCVW